MPGGWLQTKGWLVTSSASWVQGWSEKGGIRCIEMHSGEEKEEKKGVLNAYTTITVGDLPVAEHTSISTDMKSVSLPHIALTFMHQEPSKFCSGILTCDSLCLATSIRPGLTHNCKRPKELRAKFHPRICTFNSH